jgi:VanZ family protein
MAELPRRSLLRAAWPPVAWAGLIFWLSHQSRPIGNVRLFTHADKLAHAAAFGILAALAARAFGAAAWGARRILLAAVLSASLYGVADEWHQSFVPGRDPDPWDWAADTAGALAGAAAAVGLPRRKSRASIRG